MVEKKRIKKYYLLSSLLLLVFLSACQASGAQRKTLEIFAAASLTEPMGEMVRVFEEDHPDTQVMVNYAGSQVLAQQIESGADCGVFLSANIKYAKQIAESQEREELEAFIKNQLVILVDANRLPDDFDGLMEKIVSSQDLKLVLAHEDVPVGRYTQQFMADYSQATEGNAAVIEALKEQVVSYENDVKAVLTKIRQHEGDMGMVYGTDLYGLDLEAENLAMIALPKDYEQVATYGAITLNDQEASQAFMAYLLEADGVQEILLKYGFIEGE